MSLISREKLLAHFAWWPDSCESKRDFQDIIAAQPDVDAVPVRHGRWINLQSAECSECGHVFPAFMLFQHYCPNCGAKMDMG